MKRHKWCLVLCVLLLSACSSSSPRIIESTATKQEKTAVHFLTTIYGTDAQVFSKIIEEYQEEHTDFQVLFEGYNLNGAGKPFADLIDDRIKNGRANDMVTMDVANVFEYANEGKLVDLSDHEIAQDLTAYARKDSLVNGHVMSLPLSMTAYSLWVNMDVLEECNLELPQNWEEFLYCCKVLKEHGYEPITATKNFPKLFVLACLQDVYMGENSEQLIDQLNKGEVMISQYAATGLEHLKTLIDLGYIDADKAMNYKPSDTKELFKKQEGVFAISTSNGITPEEFPFEMTLIGVPGKDGMVSLLASDRRIVIMKDSEYKEECATFLSYLSKASVQEAVLSTFGAIPAYEYKKDITVDSHMKQIHENIKEGRVMLIQEYELKFEQWKNLNDIANAMLAGSDVQAQLDALDQLQLQAISTTE